mgnify:FL=1
MAAKTQAPQYQSTAYDVLAGIGAAPAAYGIADALHDFFAHSPNSMPIGDYEQLVRSMFATAASCDLGEHRRLVFPSTTPEALRRELVEIITAIRSTSAEEARHDQS